MKNKVIDALVVGAGPCGLFQAFQLGLQGIQCEIVESREHAGGQCTELYADKPIYDIPGIPHVLAADLADYLLQQIKPFQPFFHYGKTVTRIEKDDRNHFNVFIGNAEPVIARHVVLASGAGAFTPVKMRAEGAQSIEGTTLFYTDLNTSDLNHAQIVVTGDTSAALEAVAKHAASSNHVTYIHRKRRLVDNPLLTKQLAELQKENRVQVIQGKITNVAENNNQVLLQLIDGDKKPIEITTDAIVAKLGNSPKQQDYSQWGISTTKRLIDVNPATYESNLEGLYGVGDINQYAGKRKLILCGFHEATLAAFDIASRLNPDKPVHTQYTTTSTQLLKRLGVLTDNNSQPQ